MKNILIINGSINGKSGNSQVVIEKMISHFPSSNYNLEIIELSTYLEHSPINLKEKLNWADGFIFTTGTYWDSWGSPFQNFLETITEFEASPILLFKPCSVVVTMHAFGGKEVLSRIQGVLNTMGLMIPPMSGLVYSLATMKALESNDSFALDFWSLEDLEILAHNLKAAVNKDYQFIPWPVDRKDPKRRWVTC
jgi:multimeric flavodoxin WrbA